MKNLAIVLLTAILLLASLSTFAQSTIYLVRHAEKEHNQGKDPNLTEKGQQRAKALAQILKNAEIEHVFSTDYKRTQQTASPIAALLKLEITSYNPRKLTDFSEQLKALKGNALVVGHSNTTPQLVEALGGDAKGNITEGEYDRLYQLIMLDDKVLTALLSTDTVD